MLEDPLHDHTKSTAKEAGLLDVVFSLSFRLLRSYAQWSILHTAGLSVLSGRIVVAGAG